MPVEAHPLRTKPTSPPACRIAHAWLPTNVWLGLAIQADKYHCSADQLAAALLMIIDRDGLYRELLDR